MLEFKSIQEKKFVLGQFFTDPLICNKIISSINFKSDVVIIEPSFGTGNFLQALQCIDNPKIGVEIDTELFKQSQVYNNTKLYNVNFYDFDITTQKNLFFIGNPPFRTPAYSLHSHRAYISQLTKHYGVLGIREEAVFFILHSIHLILKNKTKGEIHYIVPKSILKNNSKFYTQFKMFLKRTCRFLNINSIDKKSFSGVMQDLVCLALQVGANVSETAQEKVLVDGELIDLDDYLCLSDGDDIPFQKIFKKTYLGSVPCESLLLSVPGEEKDAFKRRLCSIIGADVLDKNMLYSLLQNEGRFHLKVFDAPRESLFVQKKLDVILSYVENIRKKKDIIKEFENIENYKEITVRDGSTRFYFRCNKLKKGKNFVYELNPNPCKSFYFTGNPSHNSTDYFGFCDYDINRNVSPGANRTVPISDIENNLTDEFKKWWRKNTEEPYSSIFDYIMYIVTTDWYKSKKKNNKRFYFSIPKRFIPKDQRSFN